MNEEVTQEPTPSPPLNPIDTFLDYLPVAELTSDETIHGAISEFHLPTLSSPLLLLQDVGPGYLLLTCSLIPRCGGKTWPAGEVLTNYMIRKYKGTTGLHGKKVVELGSGTGYDISLKLSKLIEGWWGALLKKGGD